MISRVVCGEELKRVRMSGGNPSGYQLPQWMRGEVAGLKADVFERLFVVCEAKLLNDDEMKAFADFLLEENVKGVKWFPNRDEMRGAVHRFIVARRPQDSRPAALPAKVAWTAPIVSPQVEQLKTTVLERWHSMTKADQDYIMKSICQDNHIGLSFIEEHMRRHDDLWREPERSPVALSALMDYFELQERERA